MNVTFHTLGSLAAAAALSNLTGRRNRFVKFTAGFVAGILLHGVLDFLPHQYPLPSKIDVVTAILLLLPVLVFARRKNVLLILVCFAGAVFPDVVDLGPAIAEKYSGLPVPRLPFRVFPWHLKEYSGSIYDGSRSGESNFYHLAFTAIFLSSIFICRKNFFNLKTEDKRSNLENT